MQHILCTASQVVESALSGEGFIQTTGNIFELEHLWIGPRPHLERDERFKQIIPYVILSYQGKIAAYQRTQKGGENRLHNLNSIGFGGHIDAFDLAYHTDGSVNLGKTIENSARREIDEELNISGVQSKSQLGYIVDNSNPVGRVHIGVVERWELSSEKITSNEDEIKVLGLFELEQLKQLSNMENWSEHIINKLE
ncbi:MAG: NUDIX domain-containing protein [Marinicella sp.]|nr:NUDIX domain-containing protein [Xanthomonadales bacterium]